MNRRRRSARPTHDLPGHGSTPPPEQKQELTPEERRQMEADLSNAHNAISNEDARNEASRQNERTSGLARAARRGSSNGGPIPDNIADEADAVAARMRARAKPTNAACAKNRR
ncbi:MAG: hypothetical protein ACLR8Y_00380 [Alistipes indistinctus]